MCIRDRGFKLKHFIKDMKLADDEAKKAGLHLGVLEHVLENYEALEKEGLGEDGTQSLIKRY